MIKTDKYIRIKSGEASFQLVERFDDVKKAADPNAQGEVVECKVSTIKLDFTKVKKEKDGKRENIRGGDMEVYEETPGFQSQKSSNNSSCYRRKSRKNSPKTWR